MTAAVGPSAQLIDYTTIIERTKDPLNGLIELGLITKDDRNALWAPLLEKPDLTFSTVECGKWCSHTLAGLIDRVKKALCRLQKGDGSTANLPAKADFQLDEFAGVVETIQKTYEVSVIELFSRIAERFHTEASSQDYRNVLLSLSAELPDDNCYTGLFFEKLQAFILYRPWLRNDAEMRERIFKIIDCHLTVFSRQRDKKACWLLREHQVCDHVDFYLGGHGRFPRTVLQFGDGAVQPLFFTSVQRLSELSRYFKKLLSQMPEELVLAEFTQQGYQKVVQAAELGCTHDWQCLPLIMPGAGLLQFSALFKSCCAWLQSSPFPEHIDSQRAKDILHTLVKMQFSLSTLEMPYWQAWEKARDSVVAAIYNRVDSPENLRHIFEALQQRPSVMPCSKKMSAIPARKILTR